MRWVNRFFIRHVAKASATQNVETEKVGVLNKLFYYVYQSRSVAEGVRQISVSLYYFLKFALILGGIWLLFFS